jgi:hypothetical protein
MKYSAYLASALVVAVMAAGCGGGSVALKNGELRNTIEAPTQSGDFIEAMGIGAADPALPTSTQRKATSRNAAVVDAQYQLVAKLKGVTIEGGITIEKAMETNSKITASVNNMVKGCEVTKIEWTNDDGCVVTVRLNKKAVEQELGVRLK